MEVPIQHIIGTIALMGLVISIGLSYTIITDFLQTDTRRQQLQEISENVALHVVEIVNLANFGNSGSGVMTCTLNLPSDVAGKTYIVEIFEDGTSLPNSWYINAYLVTNHNINATSLIPLRAGQSKTQLETTSGTLAEITYGPIYGGGNNTVVWAQKTKTEETEITRAGLGRLSAGG